MHQHIPVRVMGVYPLEPRPGVAPEESNTAWWVLGLALLGVVAVAGAAIYAKSNEVEDWVVPKKPKPKNVGPFPGWGGGLGMNIVDNSHHGPYCICSLCH